MELTEDDIQPQLTRRRPGQSKLTTPRNESDIVSILSGTEAGRTLGTPIGLFVPNKDQRPGDYKEMSQIPRPGHADYTYQVGDVVRNTAHHALHQGTSSYTPSPQSTAPNFRTHFILRHHHIPMRQ